MTADSPHVSLPKVVRDVRVVRPTARQGESRRADSITGVLVFAPWQADWPAPAISFLRLTPQILPALREIESSRTRMQPDRNTADEETPGDEESGSQEELRVRDLINRGDRSGTTTGDQDAPAPDSLVGEDDRVGNVKAPGRPERTDLGREGAQAQRSPRVRETRRLQRRTSSEGKTSGSRGRGHRRPSQRIGDDDRSTSSPAGRTGPGRRPAGATPADRSSELPRDRTGREAEHRSKDETDHEPSEREPSTPDESGSADRSTPTGSGDTPRDTRGDKSQSPDRSDRPGRTGDRDDEPSVSRAERERGFDRDDRTLREFPDAADETRARPSDPAEAETGETESRRDRTTRERASRPPPEPPQSESPSESETPEPDAGPSTEPGQTHPDRSTGETPESPAPGEPAPDRPVRRSIRERRRDTTTGTTEDSENDEARTTGSRRIRRLSRNVDDEVGVTGFDVGVTGEPDRAETERIFRQPARQSRRGRRDNRAVTRRTRTGTAGEPSGPPSRGAGITDPWQSVVSDPAEASGPDGGTPVGAVRRFPEISSSGADLGAGVAALTDPPSMEPLRAGLIAPAQAARRASSDTMVGGGGRDSPGDAAVPGGVAGQTPFRAVRARTDSSEDADLANGDRTGHTSRLPDRPDSQPLEEHLDVERLADRLARILERRSRIERERRGR